MTTSPEASGEAEKRLQSVSASPPDSRSKLPVALEIVVLLGAVARRAQWCAGTKHGRRGRQAALPERSHWAVDTRIRCRRIAPIADDGRSVTRGTLRRREVRHALKLLHGRVPLRLRRRLRFGLARRLLLLLGNPSPLLRFERLHDALLFAVVVRAAAQHRIVETGGQVVAVLAGGDRLIEGSKGGIDRGARRRGRGCGRGASICTPVTVVALRRRRFQAEEVRRRRRRAIVSRFVLIMFGGVHPSEICAGPLSMVVAVPCIRRFVASRRRARASPRLSLLAVPDLAVLDTSRNGFLRERTTAGARAPFPLAAPSLRGVGFRVGRRGLAGAEGRVGRRTIGRIG